MLLLKKCRYLLLLLLDDRRRHTEIEILIITRVFPRLDDVQLRSLSMFLFQAEQRCVLLPLRASSLAVSHISGGKGEERLNDVGWEHFVPLPEV